MMSLLVALLLGVCYPKLLGSKLAQGEYGIKVTFWGFGLFSCSVVFIGLFAFAIYKVGLAQSDPSFGVMGALSLVSMLKALSLCGLLYMHLVYVGIWNSSRRSGFWVKVLARYFSVSILLMPAVGLMPGATSLMLEYLVFGVGVYKGKDIVRFACRGQV